MHSTRACAVMASLSVAAVAAAETVNVFDGTFLPSNWTITSFEYGPFGGSASASQSLTDGLPGEARQVTNSCGPSFSGSTNVSIYTGFTYVPAVSGPLTNLTFYMTSRYVDGLSAIGFAVEQGGHYWSVGDWLNTSSWMGYQASTIAEGFTSIDGFAPHPDFSAAGAPIHFGFYSANSSAGGSGYSRTGLYDNFNVTFVPTPGTLAIGAFGVLVAARRRR